MRQAAATIQFQGIGSSAWYRVFERETCSVSGPARFARSLLQEQSDELNVIVQYRFTAITGNLRLFVRRTESRRR